MRLKRTNNNGELRLSEKGKKVVLAGWVHHRRDHGGVIFIDLRDRWGLTQVVFNPERFKDAHAAAEQIRNEWVISVHGTVEPRMEGMANPNLATGDIEVICDDIEILSKSQPVPFPLDEFREVGEDIRLKYRFLDLRRDEVQQNLIFRSKVAGIVRNYFLEKNFVYIPYDMRHAKDFPDRGSLPHHNEIAVDAPLGKDNKLPDAHKLYQTPKAYQEQFNLRFDAAKRHVAQTYEKWKLQNKN